MTNIIKIFLLIIILFILVKLEIDNFYFIFYNIKNESILIEVDISGALIGNEGQQNLFKG